MASIACLPEFNPVANFTSEGPGVFIRFPSVGILESEEAGDPIQLFPPERIYARAGWPRPEVAGLQPPVPVENRLWSLSKRLVARSMEPNNSSLNSSGSSRSKVSCSPFPYPNREVVTRRRSARKMATAR